jgi:NTE family protein
VTAARPGRRRLLVGGAVATGLAALGVGWGMAGDTDHDGPEAPAAAPLVRRPRVAWVFGSGGPRGFVHVGVLRALDELGLEPDLVVGASVGALVGALRASGLSAQRIEALAMEVQPWRLARPAWTWPKRLSGVPVADWVREHAPQPRLERFPTPMVCVAQRVDDGEVVGFSRGDAGVAVQAACAIDGQFVPVRIRGRRYADADLRMPLPVRVARALGAERVLAVDASAHEDRAPPGAERYRETDLLKRALTRPDAELADVVLHPDFGYWAGSSRAYRERVISSGREATLATADRLRALHAR